MTNLATSHPRLPVAITGLAVLAAASAGAVLLAVAAQHAVAIVTGRAVAAILRFVIMG